MALPESVLAAWESCSKTDTLFILVCSVFCWPIILAVGLGYSGYSTRRSGLSSFYLSLLTVATCSIQWWAIGYSLAYGEGSGVIGDLKNAFHRGVLAEPVGTIPAILFSEFQLIFLATVGAIAVGGFVERGRLIAVIPFVFVSSLFPSLLDTCICNMYYSMTEANLSSPALEHLHLLPSRAHGLVRNRLARWSRCARLRRRHPGAHLLRRHCLRHLHLPVVPARSIPQIRLAHALASRPAQTPQHHVSIARDDDYLGQLACF